MNLFDKNNSFLMSINLHKKCIIVNLGDGNIIYEFEKYNQVLSLVYQKKGTEDRDRVKEYLITNERIIQQLEINWNNKKSNKNNKNENQYSLF